MSEVWNRIGWAAVGGAIGLMLGWWSPQLLRHHHSRAWITKAVALAPTTAVLFSVLAWRTEPGASLLLASTLAAVGVPLAAIDLLEQRLPTALVWSGRVPALLVIAAELARHHTADEQ